MPKVSDAYLEARKQQILVAAIACFARNGIQGTSMQDIFQESKLSPGAVYRYFPSKRDIIQATCEISATQMADYFQRLQQEDPSKALNGFAKLSFGMLEDPGMEPSMRAGMAFLAEAIRDDSIADVYRSMSQSLIGVLANMVAGMQKRGIIPAEIDAEYLGRVLYALREGCLSQKLIEPDLDVKKFVKTMEQALIWDKEETDPE